MNDFKYTLIIGLLLASIRSVEAAPGDYIRLSAGGVMTSGLEISIDLDTGSATKRTMQRGSIAPGERPNWHETETQLTPQELKKLTDTIRDSLSEGFESQHCLEQDEAARGNGQRPPMLMPTMDSITLLYLHLDGRDTYAPSRECRTSAFSKVWEATYHAADSR